MKRLITAFQRANLTVSDTKTLYGIGAVALMAACWPIWFIQEACHYGIPGYEYDQRLLNACRSLYKSNHKSK